MKTPITNAAKFDACAYTKHEPAIEVVYAEDIARMERSNAALRQALRQAHSFFSAGLACGDFEREDPVEYRKVKSVLDAMLTAITADASQ